MKILFVAVFNEKSSNFYQAETFESLDVDVVRYEYRIRANQIGRFSRDQEIIDLCRKESPELILFGKGSSIDFRVFEECKKEAVVGLWFPDPLVTYNTVTYHSDPAFVKDEMRIKTKLASFFCCDKYNVFEAAKELNLNSHLIFDGLDSRIEYPKNYDQDIDVSFIGDVNTHIDSQYRKNVLSAIRPPIKIFDNAYGKEHSVAVSRSKININLCTAEGASARIYRILGARGLLFSDDWYGRIEGHNLIDGEDLVVFNSIDDLNEKVQYYLSRPEERELIRNSGYKKIQKYNKVNWAKKIIQITEELL